MAKVEKLILLIGLFLVAKGSGTSAAKTVFCYWGTWANYRTGNGQFQVSNIDPHLCTHIGYAFFGLSQGNEITYLDSWLDLDLDNIGKAVALKQINSNLKVLASVGGWNEGSTKYSAMAADAGKRAIFIASAVNFVRRHGFDGLDFDWEYPAQRGGSSADRVNFVTLLKELKAALAPYNLLLTIAVAAAEPSASISYDILSVAQHVDLINVMTYDFAGSWDSVVGFNAPLLGAGQNTVTAAIEYWLGQGAPAEKLVLGIAFYGRSFTLADSSQTNVGARSTGPGLAGPYTREPGFLGYNEICEQIDGWTKQWDSTHLVPFAYKGNQWVGYDDVQSISLKMDYVKSRNLGGAMVWTIDTDDFRGICGEKFALLKAINGELNEAIESTAATTTKIQPSSSTSTSSTTTSSTNPNDDCQMDGSFVNREDCTRFYVCSGGNRVDFQCPSGLYFDQSIGVCNWPNFVDCRI